ncbi:MAG: hypothetical protein Q4A62_10655 [Eikenella sp.]|nr:hypothetical protein [Eikenella sp.]
MTPSTAQALTAAAAAIFMLGALAAISSCEAPPPTASAWQTASAAPAADIKPAARKAARLAVLASPWQGMSDEDLLAGVVFDPVEGE